MKKTKTILLILLFQILAIVYGSILYFIYITDRFPIAFLLFVSLSLRQMFPIS
ncbi:hypothetical protein [Leptospira stimsonii]|uniref:hypothetical protein n=1 Tax=Leptospira stimsonii TaxID=2202203 RepID=UPI00131444D7|nr:hypothetical protein [Leptospira stimsonii]